MKRKPIAISISTFILLALHPGPAPADLDDPIEVAPVERATLANGLRLLVIERHEQPVVYFNLRLRGGELLEQPGKAGLASFTADLLREGTATRTSEAISETVDSTGGRLSAASKRDCVIVSARFLKRDFEAGLDLFADVILNPLFPAAEIDRLRPRYEFSVRSVRNDPNAMAREHLGYLIFGYGNPAGRPVTLETLRSVTREDILAFYRAQFRPDRAILGITGDVNPDEVRRAIEGAFGTWEAAAAPADEGRPEETAPGAGRPAGLRIRLVDKDDLTQSSIALGAPGLKRSNPDYLPVQLANYTLGGGAFSSRLMKVIRSEGGKTYSVRSSFGAGLEPGAFRVSTFTRTSETLATLRLLLEEIRAFRDGGVTEEELAAAKKNLAGKYPLRIETPSGLAREILAAEFYGLGDDYVRTYRQKVMSASLEEVNAAAGKYVEADDLAVVVVGRAAEVGDDLLTLGPVETINYLEAVADEERTAGTGGD